MEMQTRIRRSFQTEMMAAGLYQTLAAQYVKSHPELSAMLKEAGQQEYRHGLLFARHYHDNYGGELTGERYWLKKGKMIGWLMMLLPLGTKIRKLCDKEAAAVQMIENELLDNQDSSYQQILKTILPDEQAHAGIYKQVFLK